MLQTKSVPQQPMYGERNRHTGTGDRGRRGQGTQGTGDRGQGTGDRRLMGTGDMDRLYRIPSYRWGKYKMG